MRIKIYQLILALLLAVAPVTGAELYPTLLQKVAGVYSYESNTLSEYNGDVVVVLSDGSAWKIHPKDREEFIWNFSTGDPVFVSWRTSGFWRKREHHLCLNNLLNQKVQPSVMLVSYPKVSATVVKIENTLPQRIHLSDGSVWTESHSFAYKNNEQKMPDLAIDTKVYVGLNRFSNGRYSYFLTNGLERDARMLWVDKAQ